MPKKLIPFGEQVGIARRLAGLTQDELASRVGISRSYLAKLETSAPDALDPGIGLVTAIAAVLKNDWFGPGFVPIVKARRLELKRAAKTPKPNHVRKSP